MRKLTILICFAGLVMFAHLTVVAQDFTIEQSPKMVLRVDIEKKVAVKTAGETPFNAAGDIQLSGGDGSVQISPGTLSADKKKIEFTVKGLATKDSFELTAKSTIDPDGIKPKTLQVQVLAKLSAANLKVTPDDANVSITEGGSKKFTLTADAGLDVKDNEITIETSENDENISFGKIRNREFIVTAIKVGEPKLSIKANGEEIYNRTVKVTDGVDLAKFEGKPISVRIGKKKSLSEHFGKDWDKLKISEEPAPSVAVLTDNGTKIEGKTVNTTFIKIKLKDSDALDSKDQQVNINVVPEASTMTFTELRNTMVVNSSYETTVTVMATDGSPITGAAVDIKPDKGSCIDVTPKDGQKFTIKALSPCPLVKLTATAKFDENDKVTKTFDVSIVIVAGFKPLKIRLDMMDNQTAIDLFGKKAVDEYFIAKVRLFNNIKEDSKEFGDSILVYSESLEVMVAVEWREPGAKGGPKPVYVWGTDRSGNKTQTQAKDEEGNDLSLDYREWQTLDVATAKNWFPNAKLTANRKNDLKNPCVVLPQTNMFVPYRPLTFEMVSNTQERRNQRSWRSRLLTAIYGLTSMTSFITTVAVPKSSNDLKPGLDNFRNLIIPNFEKLFPSYNEVQRQNITSMVMRPLEEVPYGSDITRVLFFPKRKITGVLFDRPNARKTELRISAISISDACADVGIIKKVRNDSEDEEQINQ